MKEVEAMNRRLETHEYLLQGIVKMVWASVEIQDAKSQQVSKNNVLKALQEILSAAENDPSLDSERVTKILSSR